MTDFICDPISREIRSTCYDVHIVPDLVAWTFKGDVVIHVDVLRDTNKVILNSADLVYQHVVINGEVVTDIVLDTKLETVCFNCNNTLHANTKVDIKIQYTGVISDKLEGFYRSKYSKDGKECYMAVTQFESTDCRRCIPSQDHPSFKATFKMKITVPSGKTCLSNMPVLNTVIEGVNTTWIFEETPKMSCYLLAFAIGDFDYVETVAANGVNVRVYAPVSHERGKFACDVAARGLVWLEEFFDMKFPLPAVKMLSVPDFAFGAMENWGLITYRETAILYDETSSLAVKQRVALVVLHELSHSWFGNFVTMSDWNGLWLNEGFATWAEYIAADHLFPEWHIIRDFVSADCASALRLAALESSHPVDIPITEESQIKEIFDDISYAFGCALIRMTNYILGEDVFKKGIRSYIKKYAYANATTDDLWASLSEASGRDVPSLLNSWVHSTGYPVVIVNSVTDNVLHCTQSRFLSTGRKYGHDDVANNPLWTIPLSPSNIVSTRNFDVTLEKGSKLNAGQHCLYRALYTSDQWREFVKTAPSLADPLDRYGLLSDAFALTKAGMLDISIVLDLVRALAVPQEKEMAVWNEIFSVLSALRNLIMSTSREKQLDKFIENVLLPVYHRLGFEVKQNEPVADSQLRVLTISMLSSVRCQAVVQQATDLFKSKAVVHADLRPVLYGIQMREHDSLDALLAIHDHATQHEERVRVYRAITCTRKPELISKVLDLVLSGYVKPQDSFFITNFLAAEHQNNRPIVFEWLKKNMPELNKKLGEAMLIQGRMIMSMAGSNSQSLLDDMTKYFETNTHVNVQRTVSQCLESISANVKFKERDLPRVEQWIDKL